MGTVDDRRIFLCPRAAELSFLLALLGLALVCKKAFCGWACPIGLLGELAARLGGRVWRRRPRIACRANGVLKLLRYVMLAVALFFTYRTGELVLRGYDPYFLIFSGLWTRKRGHSLGCGTGRGFDRDVGRSDVLLPISVPHGCRI